MRFRGCRPKERRKEDEKWKTKRKEMKENEGMKEMKTELRGAVGRGRVKTGTVYIQSEL